MCCHGNTYVQHSPLLPLLENSASSWSNSPFWSTKKGKKKWIKIHNLKKKMKGKKHLLNKDTHMYLYLSLMIYMYLHSRLFHLNYSQCCWEWQMLTFLFYVNRNSFSNKGFIIRQGIRYPTRVSLSDKCLNIILLEFHY